MAFINTEQRIADLEGDIRMLLPLLDDLERTLLTEEQALASRDAAALLGIVDAKRRSLRKLDTALAGTELASALESHSHLGDTGRTAAAPSWQDFTQRLQRCRSLNQAIGGAVAALQRHTSEGLRLLGLALEPEAYDVDGRTTPRNAGPVRAPIVC